MINFESFEARLGAEIPERRKELARLFDKGTALIEGYLAHRKLFIEAALSGMSEETVAEAAKRVYESQLDVLVVFRREDGEEIWNVHDQIDRLVKRAWNDFFTEPSCGCSTIPKEFPEPEACRIWWDEHVRSQEHRDRFAQNLIRRFTRILEECRGPTEGGSPLPS